MGYTIVNYHYIRPRPERGLHPCTLERFEAQLSGFRQSHTIVPLSKLYDAVQRGRDGNFLSLTFDDGLKEHYTQVLPRLRKCGVTGCFFPIGLPLREKKIPVVHKLHLILSRLPTARVVERFHSFFHRRRRIDDKERINPRRRFDDILTSNLKETLIALPWQERVQFIERVFQEECGDENQWSEELFLTPDEIRGLARAGMEIGGHGYEHRSLEGMGYEEQDQDIRTGSEVIRDATGFFPRLFSYPHGRYNQDTLSILRELGVSLAVILTPREVTTGDDALLLPRFDTNDIRV